MKPWVRTLSSVLGQVILALAVFFLTLEAGVRIFRPQSLLMKGKESFFPGDPDLQFAMRPSATTELGRHDFRITVKTNALGLRDIDRGPKGSALRILAVGDSFTFGWGVEREKTFQVEMERTQDSDPAGRGERPIEVINAGVPGYTLYQYLLQLETKGWRLDPDVVLVGLFVQNDLSENSVTQAWLERKRKGLLKKGEKTGLEEWLEKHAQGYVWLRVKYKSSYRMQRTWYRLTRRFTNKEEEVKYRNLLVLRKPVSPEMETEWKLSEEILLKLRDSVRARGRRLLVVLFPSELQAVRAEWEREVRAEKMSPDTFDLDAANRRLADFCGREGIPVLDLLPGFRKATDSGEVLYLPSDHHWNPRGHALASRLILAELRARGWLAAPTAPASAPAGHPSLRKFPSGKVKAPGRLVYTFHLARIL